MMRIPDFPAFAASFGERHPYYALALAGWGMQYHWAGKDVPAERLLKQAIEVSERSLGPLHPDHALIVSSLGQLYRDMGKTEESELLLAEASRIAMDVFGSPMYRGSPILRQQIDLDLRSDPRNVLQVQGPIEWAPGRLTLGPGTHIRQDLDLGAQVKLKLRLAFGTLTDDSQTSTTHFAFQIRDRGAIVVQILRRAMQERRSPRSSS